MAADSAPSCCAPEVDTDKSVESQPSLTGNAVDSGSSPEGMEDQNKLPKGQCIESTNEGDLMDVNQPGKMQGTDGVAGRDHQGTFQ